MADKIKYTQKEVKPDELPTIYEEPIPSLYVDGFKGAVFAHGNVRINLFENRLNPNTELFTQTVVARLIMPVETLRSMNRTFTDIINTIPAAQAMAQTPAQLTPQPDTKSGE